jgi:predicted O-methyltransferase YrrM
MAAPTTAPDRLTRWGWKTQAWLRELRPTRWDAATPHPLLAEALGRWANDRSDIHDHLGTIFAEAMASAPKLIVELGTRSGLSTRALLAAAELTDAQLLSVDLEDCSGVEFPERFRPRWSFAVSDDVAFAGAPFEAWCAARGVAPSAEVIFIDTSHLYEHTTAEIAAWLPRLAPGGAMLFHDTNMGDWYRRLDGRTWRGWNNERGVIRAIEEHFGRRYDERRYFVDVADGFLVRHAPWSNGLTVLRRLGNDAGAA